MSFYFTTRRGALCVGLGLLVLAGAAGGCKQDVQLTRPAAVGPAPAVAAPQRREPTTLGFGVPIDLKPAEAIAETALPASLGRFVEWFNDAACAKRNRWVECNGAKAEIDVERNGPVSIAVEAGRITLKVPLKYALTARGLGWAREIQDSRSGELVATIPIDAQITPAFAADVRLAGPITLSEPTIPVLKAKLALGRLIEGRLKKPLGPVVASVRDSIQAKELRPLAEKAWRALHAPIELGREPQIWLRVEPERIAGVDFAGDGGELLLRYAINARLTATTGQRPAPLLPRPMPELPVAAPDRTAAAEGMTELRLPITISSDPLLKALQEAFPAKDTLNSSVTADAVPLASKVGRVSLFQARGQLGIELQLDIVEPARWAGMVGTAHFIATPVIRNNTVLELDAVGLPDSGSKVLRSPQKQPTPSPNVPRIGAEPFASRIARAGRMTIEPVINGVLPQANSMIEQPLGNGFQLGGRFESLRIDGVQVVRDGFELTVSLAGNLLMRYAPEQAMAAPAQPPPSVR